MFTIWKYQLPQGSMWTSIPMPKNAEVLSAGSQDDMPFVWVKVPQISEGHENRNFLVVETGVTVSSNARETRFIGTVLLDGGRYVLHVFEELQ